MDEISNENLRKAFLKYKKLYFLRRRVEDGYDFFKGIIEICPSVCEYDFSEYPEKFFTNPLEAISYYRRLMEMDDDKTYYDIVSYNYITDKVRRICPSVFYYVRRFFGLCE